jgi:uncharacterized membrane protein
MTGTPRDRTRLAHTRNDRGLGFGSAVGWLTAGLLLLPSSLQSWLSEAALSASFVSPATRGQWLRWLGLVNDLPAGAMPPDSVAVPWTPLFGLAVAIAALMTLCSTFIRRRQQDAWSTATRHGITTSGQACAFIGSWEVVSVALATIGWTGGLTFWSAAIPFWVATALAWWVCKAGGRASTANRTTQPASASSVLEAGSSTNPRGSAAVDAARIPTPLRPLLIMATIYALVFVTMNWRLWDNLLIPHGDSVMYEEHLWNVLHGKGFRSYLDQGLFLGEHIQVIHLALLPIYVLWPSHRLLELCESCALALGVIPVAQMVLRHTGCRTAALWLAGAYLLYFPTQFLDIEIDLKTFRPEAFGIPLLLWTLSQCDARHWRRFALGLLCCLAVKEDYAIVLAPLGLWIAMQAVTSRRNNVGDTRKMKPNDAQGTIAVGTFDEAMPPPGSLARSRSEWWSWSAWGLGLSAAATGYLWWATRIAIPYFRPGEEVHYARYFSRFGSTPEEIVTTFLFRPWYVAEQFLTTSTALYVLALLVPVGWLALRSPGRLAVGLPLFVILCLNELAQDPRHQFHAPLVAIVFWAAAAGLRPWSPAPMAWVPKHWRRWTSHRRNVAPSASAAAAAVRSPSKPKATTEDTLFNGRNAAIEAQVMAIAWSRWALWSAAFTGLFFSLSPLGFTFWDPGSQWSLWALYGPSPRGPAFAQIADLIPRSARVASTDFVHPRYTHHERSYDYSGYRRKVSGYEHRVPTDTDYIVIDTHHRYSQMRRAADIPEYHDRENWELLDDRTGGLFLVLKRKRPPPDQETGSVPDGSAAMNAPSFGPPSIRGAPLIPATSLLGPVADDGPQSLTATGSPP